MKRSDLPRLAITTGPDGKRHALVSGVGVMMEVRDLPDGLIAFCALPGMVKHVEWSVLEAIAAGEAVAGK